MDLAQVIDQLSPSNKRLAEQLIKQLAAQDGISVDFDQHYLAPLENIPLWVAWLKTNSRSPRTIDMYKADAINLLTKQPQPTPLSLQQYFAGRLEQVSPARVSSEQKAMKSLFSYLHKQGLYPTNPTIDIVLIKGADREIECPSDQQVMAMLGAKLRRSKDDIKFKVMLVLLINTGLRIEEACSLRRDNINLNALEVKVLGKGSKERTVPISELAAVGLYKYMQDNPTDSPWLFPANTKTGYWGHSGFRKALRHACQRAGVKVITPHQLRHYFATRTLEHGAKLEIISKILGHANVSITASIYRHIQLQEFHKEHKLHDPLEQLPKLLKEGGDKQ